MRKPVSIVMAAWQGEKYIQDQMESIVQNMQPCDELIISLDPGGDRTEEIIRSFADRRIHLVRGPGQGVAANFENGLRQAQNELVVLSDQDDLWKEGRLDVLCAAFEDPAVQAVVGDACVVDENLQEIASSFYEMHRSRNGFVSNLIRNSMIGCCMAFRKSLLQTALPFPKDIPMHDQWLGLLAYTKGKVLFLPDVVTLYRRHAGNATSLQSASPLRQLSWRLHLTKALALRLLFQK